MSFSDIAGHAVPKQVLQRAIRTDRVSHAYLFEGPAHVGKTLTALAFAKALMCSQPPSPGESCGECAICRAVDRGNHPDFLLLRPTTRLEAQDEEGQKAVADIEGSEIRTDAVGQLIDRAYGRALAARRKVLIVAEAQAMNPVAANHLLKTLEEPPPGTTLLLLASSTSALLPTIVSRCQLVRFGPVPLADAVPALERLFPETDAELVRSVAALSGGRPGWAHRLLSHPETLRVRGQLLDLIHQLADEPMVGCLRAAETLIEASEAWWTATTEGGFSEKLFRENRDRVLRTQISELLDILLTWFRDLAVAREADSSPPLINADRATQLRRLAQGISDRAPARAAAAIRRTKDALRGNANLRLTVEVMLLDIWRALATA